MTNQNQQLPRLAVDVLADFVNTTFATKAEVTEAYVEAVWTLGRSHLLPILLTSCIYKLEGLSE